MPDAPDAPGATRTDEAYAEIKRRILDLEMAPGTSFTEGALAAEMGLSKTPVREALGRLRQERLADAVARSGYQVAPVTLKETRDLFQVRMVLEAEAAALAAERGVDIEALLELDLLCRTSYEPGDRSSILRFLKANARFHVMLGRLSGNEFLASALEGVLDRLHRPFILGLLHTTRPDDITHGHIDLLDAVKAGDAHEARKVAAAEATRAQRMVINGLLASPALLSTNLGGSASERQ
ncbi:MAG: GntR family transcriptional regulator [Actinobacteria bacterium]|nr:GntR family transcriptional regulator [Actinomycetota bacterium]